MPATLKTYYVGCRWVWPCKGTVGPEVILATSARNACKKAIRMLNETISRFHITYNVVSRKDVDGGSIHQVLLRWEQCERNALIVVAALAAGVPEVSQ